MVPVATNQPQAVVTTDCKKEIVGNAGIPSSKDVLNLIALKYFQNVNPSKEEEFNGFIQYLERMRKLLYINAHSGSLIITVECSSLKILEALWEDYCTGHLNEMAQKFLVTEDILKAFDLIDVKLTTTIVQEEYRACREHFLKCQGEYDRIQHVYTQGSRNRCKVEFLKLLVLVTERAK